MRIIRAADKPFVPAGHENLLSPGVWKRVLFQKDELLPGRVQMVNWARLPPGKSFAPHYHEDMQEFFIILSGTAQMSVGPQTASLSRGDTVLMDPREVHEMRNAGAEDVEYIAIGIATGVGGRTVVV